MNTEQTSENIFTLSKNQIILFLFCRPTDRPTLFFLLSPARRPKNNLVIIIIIIIIIIINIIIIIIIIILLLLLFFYLCLRIRFSPLELHTGNLELSLPPSFLDSRQTQNNKMISWTDPTSSFP